MGDKRKDRRRSSRLARKNVHSAVSIGCGALTTLALGILVIGQLLPPGEHAHPAGPHGGMLVALSGGRGHVHGELVIGAGGALELYPLAVDQTSPAAADSRLVLATVTPNGSPGSVEAVFRPAVTDGGPVYRLIGRLPADLIGRPVTVEVRDLVIGGEAYAATFRAVPTGREGEVIAAYRRHVATLYATPQGAYTAFDVTAAKGQTPAETFAGLHPAHELRPSSGQRICPVTRAKAHDAVRWSVGGKLYWFCCPPCIDEFVEQARTRPGELKDPSLYVR